MIKTIKNIGLIVVAVFLIIATSGFSIFRHVCSCDGVVTTSVFMEPTCHHAQAETASSCSMVKATHSCCAVKPVKESRPVCHKGECCNTTSLFLKISDSFQPGNDNTVLKPVPVAVAFIIPDQITLENNFSFNLFNDDRPPPPSGKQIIVAHHQLKLDPALV